MSSNIKISKIDNVHIYNDAQPLHLNRNGQAELSDVLSRKLNYLVQTNLFQQAFKDFLPTAGSSEETHIRIRIKDREVTLQRLDHYEQLCGPSISVNLDDYFNEDSDPIADINQDILNSANAIYQGQRRQHAHGARNSSPSLRGRGSSYPYRHENHRGRDYERRSSRRGRHHSDLSRRRPKAYSVSPSPSRSYSPSSPSPLLTPTKTHRTIPHRSPTPYFNLSTDTGFQASQSQPFSIPQQTHQTYDSAAFTVIPPPAYPPVEPQTNEPNNPTHTTSTSTQNSPVTISTPAQTSPIILSFTPETPTAFPPFIPTPTPPQTPPILPPVNTPPAPIILSFTPEIPPTLPPSTPPLPSPTPIPPQTPPIEPLTRKFPAPVTPTDLPVNNRFNWSISSNDFQKLIELSQSLSTNEHRWLDYFPEVDKKKFMTLPEKIRNDLYFQIFLLDDPSRYPEHLRWPIGERLFLGEGKEKAYNECRADAIRHYLLFSLACDFTAAGGKQIPEELLTRLNKLNDEDKASFNTQLGFVSYKNPTDPDITNQERSKALLRGVEERNSKYNFHRNHQFTDRLEKEFEKEVRRLEEEHRKEIARLKEHYEREAARGGLTQKV